MDLENDVEVTKDLTYAEVDGQALALDLYRPATDETVPVVLYLHGGGYRAGNKADDVRRLAGLAREGVAVASANYRLAPHATYPAPIHDAKAAVRWLRAHAAEHRLAPGSVGAWGASAGGYLASMLGLTADDTELEGEAGDHSGESGAVQAVVSWFAPSDLIANSRRSWLEKLVLGEPAEHSLFGRDVIPEDDDLVRAASPLARVTRRSPPFLIATGDRDRIVAEYEARALHDTLTRHGVAVTSTLLGGAGHEDPRFDEPWHLATTAAWLRHHLS